MYLVSLDTTLCLKCHHDYLCDPVEGHACIQQLWKGQNHKTIIECAVRGTTESRKTRAGCKARQESVASSQSFFLLVPVKKFSQHESCLNWCRFEKSTDARKNWYATSWRHTRTWNCSYMPKYRHHQPKNNHPTRSHLVLYCLGIKYGNNVQWHRFLQSLRFMHYTSRIEITGSRALSLSSCIRCCFGQWECHEEIVERFVDVLGSFGGNPSISDLKWTGPSSGSRHFADGRVQSATRQDVLEIVKGEGCSLYPFFSDDNSVSQSNETTAASIPSVHR